MQIKARKHFFSCFYIASCDGGCSYLLCGDKSYIFVFYMLSVYQAYICFPSSTHTLSAVSRPTPGGALYESVGDVVATGPDTSENVAYGVSHSPHTSHNPAYAVVLKK